MRYCYTGLKLDLTGAPCVPLPPFSPATPTGPYSPKNVNENSLSEAFTAIICIIMAKDETNKE